jgi:hypothetical protein
MNQTELGYDFVAESDDHTCEFYVKGKGKRSIMEAFLFGSSRGFG